jgi:pSer/pThr/pTyr-binding forkhead associated (FHA) protein
MTRPPTAPHASSPVELKEQIDAEKRGVPHLIYRDGSGSQRIVFLEQDKTRLTVGRSASDDIALDWDPEVSRLHAELERLGDHWTVSDDGLSKNGSFVNGVRIWGRRRLEDGDQLRFGKTTVVYRRGGRGRSSPTVADEDFQTIAPLSDAQKRVLVALCRPYKDSSGFATPASNRQIADELVVSVETVKSTMRSLFQKLGVEDVPQIEKRARLVERAFQAGLISEADL